MHARRAGAVRVYQRELPQMQHRTALSQASRRRPRAPAPLSPSRPRVLALCLSFAGARQISQNGRSQLLRNSKLDSCSVWPAKAQTTQAPEGSLDAAWRDGDAHARLTACRLRRLPSGTVEQAALPCPALRPVLCPCSRRQADGPAPQRRQGGGSREGGQQGRPSKNGIG